MKVLALLCCLAAASAVVSAVDVDHLPSNILAPRFAEADAGLTATTTVKAFGKCKALLQKMVQDNGYAGKGGHIYMWHFTDWDTDKVKVGATYSEARTGHIRMTEDSGKLINKKTAELIADIEVKDAQVAENKWKELYPADGNPKKISVPHKKKMNGYTEWYKLGTASPAAALALVKGVVAAKCGDGKAGDAGVIYLWHFAVNNPNNWKVGLSSKADAVDRAYAESRGTGEEAADVQTIPCNDYNGAEDAWKVAKADIRYQNTDMSQPMDGYTEWWDCSLTV